MGNIKWDGRDIGNEFRRRIFIVSLSLGTDSPWIGLPGRTDLHAARFSCRCKTSEATCKRDFRKHRSAKSQTQRSALRTRTAHRWS